MAYFAINVKSGCERLVASHIKIVSQKHSRTDIKEVIVPVTNIIDATEKNIRHTIKAKLNSYVFVSVETSSDQNMDADTYQFLKGVSPYIRQILPHSLSKEDYTTFIESSDVEIIIAAPREETIEKPQEKHFKNFIHNKFAQLRQNFNRYIQNMFRSKGKRVFLEIDNDKLIIQSDTKTMMDLFSGTNKSIQDFITDPIRTFLDIVKGYDSKISNSC